MLTLKVALFSRRGGIDMSYRKSAGAAVALIAALTAAAGAEERATPNDALAAGAREIAGKFAEKLKSELVGATKVEGPVKAIEGLRRCSACHSRGCVGGWVVGWAHIAQNPQFQKCARRLGEAHA